MKTSKIQTQTCSSTKSGISIFSQINCAIRSPRLTKIKYLNQLITKILCCTDEI